MKRLLVVSMLSLALAGCAQSKGALSRGASYPPSPVAITPVPSIYDTINQGVGGKAVAQTAIKNPDDPQWAGRTQVSVAARPVPPGSPGAAGSPAAAPAAGPAAVASATSVASGPMQSTGPAVGPAPAPALTAAPAAAPVIPNQASPSLATSQPMPAPANAGMPAPAPVAGPRTVSSGPLMNEPAGIPAGPSPAGVNSTGAVPANVAVSSPASSMPATLAAAPAPAPAPAAAAPRRNADPLLGPEPDLMPAMPDLPAVEPAAKKVPVAAGAPPVEAAQPLVPAGGPVPDAAPAEPAAIGPAPSEALVPAEPPIGVEPSTAASKPADGGLAAVVLPLEPAPPSSQVLPANAGRAAAPSLAGGSRDSHVVLTSGEGPAVVRRGRTASLKESGRAVARVGDEVITQHELTAALLEEIDKHPELRRGGLDGASQLERSQVMNMLVRQALLGLIDRSILVQEAKRHIKDKKMLEQVYQEADKIFYEQEVLPLQRKYGVDSEAKVKERLAERGRSLEAMRLSFRQVFLAQSYMYQKLKDRLKVELPDMLRYYNDHVQEHEFDRPAQITWRELVVETARHKSREEARSKANALLEKVRRGEDFTTLARNESEGPSSSRQEGGLMRTTPGSYACKPINDALDSLPIGQVSPVIEGPDSFHIVKVENRRPAGPASFEEVQDQIKPKLESERMHQENDAFITRLKRNALIDIYLDKEDQKKS